MATFVPTTSASRAVNVEHVVEVHVTHDAEVWKLGALMPDGRTWIIDEVPYSDDGKTPAALRWWARVCGEMKAVV